MDELATLLSSEHGKTLPDAKGDIQRGIEVVEFAAASRTCSRANTPTAPAPASTSTRCASRSASSPASRPFNFPAMIPLWKSGPALACGNAFILKPSERDPSVPLRLAELFLEAGLPDGGSRTSSTATRKRSTPS